MRLLIAEDDAFFIKVLKQILAPEHQLVVARDGDEAWAALQQPHAPRLAILDWVMPGLSGPEICRKVRASASLSSMYLIILTAKNNTADIVSGLRAGADDYLTKPPVPEELRARIALGERVLALQDEIESQLVLAHQGAEREKRLREGLAGGEFYGRPPVQESLREVAAYLSRHSEPTDDCTNPGAESRSSEYQLSACSVENSNS